MVRLTRVVDHGGNTCGVNFVCLAALLPAVSAVLENKISWKLLLIKTTSMWVRYLSSSLTTRLRILAVFTTSNSLPSTCTGLTYLGCFGKLIRSSLDLVWCSFKRFRSDRSIISSSEGWISLGDISGTTTCVRLHIVR